MLTELGLSVLNYVGLRLVDPALNYISYLRKVRRLAKNNRVGKAAEKAFEQFLKDSGFDDVGRQVHVKTPFPTENGMEGTTYDRIIDLVIRKGDKLYGLELKTGRRGTRVQKTKDAWINRHGATAYGDAAKEAGIAGQDIQSITTVHVKEFK